jgi:N-acetylglucosamine repressor
LAKKATGHRKSAPPDSNAETMTKLPRKTLQDKHLIEGLIRSQGPISRVEIFKQTKMRRSTISLLTRQLISEGKLVEVGFSNNPLGRKQILLKHNPKFGFVVGIEFDDKSLTAGVMDLETAILHSFTESTNLAHGQEGLLKQLQQAAHRVVKESGFPWAKVLGVGIADPGLVDTRVGVTASCSTIDFWNQVPVRKYLEEALQVPTLVESKTRTKTIAERMLGGGAKQPNMIYLDYGTGIGAGVIVDGKLLYGQNCGAGEVGHTHIQRSGPTCKCGSTGCLEVLAGADAIEHRVRQAIEDGVTSPALANEEPESITVWKVFESAATGDKLCWNTMAEVAEDLGIAMANLVNLFNPSLIVLDQRLSIAGDEFLGMVTHVIKRQALTSSAHSVSVRYAQLGSDAGIRGVGLRVLDHYFEQRPMQHTEEPAEKEKTRQQGQSYHAGDWQHKGTGHLAR